MEKTGDLAELRAKIELLQRQVMLARGRAERWRSLPWILVAVAFMSSGLADAREADREIRVHRLVILDEIGREGIVLTAGSDGSKIEVRGVEGEAPRARLFSRGKDAGLEVVGSTGAIQAQLSVDNGTAPQLYLSLDGKPGADILLDIPGGTPKALLSTTKGAIEIGVGAQGGASLLLADRRKELDTSLWLEARGDRGALVKLKGPEGLIGLRAPSGAAPELWGGRRGESLSLLMGNGGGQFLSLFDANGRVLWRVAECR